MISPPSSACVAHSKHLVGLTWYWPRGPCTGRFTVHPRPCALDLFDTYDWVYQNQVSTTWLNQTVAFFCLVFLVLFVPENHWATLELGLNLFFCTMPWLLLTPPDGVRESELGLISGPSAPSGRHPLISTLHPLFCMVILFFLGPLTH